ncbi:MAG: flagellar motor protein MotB [Rhodobacteraceae bacterium]|nr:flagellar motor protein MotB [Paracoccaceae bacterium]
MGAPTNVAPVIIKRKKVVGGGGHHGGAWKVAYADFVTAMMAFFMLMWLLNATTEKQRKGLADYFSPTIPVNRVSGGGSGAFGGTSMFSETTLPQDGSGATDRHPTEARAARGNQGLDPDGAEAERDDALRAVQEALMARGGESMLSDEALKHIVTRVTDEGLIIELFDSESAGLFEPDSDTPTPLLRDLARMIARVSGMVTNGVALGAHTRAYPVVLADNPVWNLSGARATAMRGLLESGGLDPGRIKRVTGHADRAAADTNPMAARNNRIEVTLLRS